MGWNEESEGWQVIEDRNNGTTAVRVFHDGKDSGSSSLPVMNEAHPTISNIYVGTKTTKKIDRSESQRATIQYRKFDDDNPSGGSFDDLSRRMTIGGEMITYDEGGGWYWPDQKPVNKRVFKRIVTGTYQFSEKVAELTTSTNGVLERILSAAGKVNDAVFQGQAIGDWLYNGADLQQVSDSDSNKEWIVTHGFSFRRPNGEVGDGWQKVWNGDAGAFQIITDSPGGGDKLYTETDFATIFSTSGAA